MIKLYHGSNILVKEPHIIPSLKALDFGEGFYLTTSFEQATRWAKLVAERREVGEPIVSVYNFDDESLDSLKVLRFEKASIKWLNFVLANRTNTQNNVRYDVVIGPVADDKTMPTLNYFLKGTYTANETIKRLLTFKLQDQYVLKNERALSLLTFDEEIKI